MQTYRVLVTPAAARQLAKLDRAARERIAPAIEALGADPRPPGVVKLTDTANGYRVRAGDFRILYEVTDRELLVLVVRVANRREAYR